MPECTVCCCIDIDANCCCIDCSESSWQFVSVLGCFLLLGLIIAGPVMILVANNPENSADYNHNDNPDPSAQLKGGYTHSQLQAMNIIGIIFTVIGYPLFCMFYCKTFCNLFHVMCVGN